MTSWRDVHLGFEGDGAEIFGLDVWKHHWRHVDRPGLNLPHPSYPSQSHRFDIYEIGEIDRPVRFAAGELSNGVWGFYVPN